MYEPIEKSFKFCKLGVYSSSSNVTDSNSAARIDHSGWKNHDQRATRTKRKLHLCWLASVFQDLQAKESFCLITFRSTVLVACGHPGTPPKPYRLLVAGWNVLIQQYISDPLSQHDNTMVYLHKTNNVASTDRTSLY